MEPWNAWNHGTMERLEPQLRNHGTMERLEPWNYGTLNHGTVEPRNAWNCGTLEP